MMVVAALIERGSLGSVNPAGPRSWGVPIDDEEEREDEGRGRDQMVSIISMDVRCED